MSARSLTAQPNFDLSRVMPRVKRDNPDWTDERLGTTEFEYRRFMQLCKTFPEQKISAAPDIDKVWHAHMLDSVFYMRDCDDYFGYYLHHDPCIGETDLDGVNDTLATFTKAYGIEPTPAWMGLMTCANPGGGCGSIRA
jgi:hypothetical protein